MPTYATYASAFPPLTSFSLASTGLSVAPLKCPAYLEHTLYTVLSQEQHRLQQRPAQRSHRAEEGHDLSLPSYWNEEEKSRHIAVGRNGLDLVYVGPGKSDSNAASARANSSMPPQCGVYYFEMHVLSKGQDGYIGIGFCTHQSNRERLPGWDVGSWGYHGDDGHVFAASGTGRPYGPTFTTGDVVGCGVNFATQCAFFTKNGAFLGNAFQNINTAVPLYPVLGLRTAGEHVTTNFGQDPFAYDIVQYVKDQQQRAWEAVSKRSLQDGRSLINQLLVSYLAHHGCARTAEIFCNEANVIETVADKGKKQHLERRASIRTAVLNGQMDQAMTMLQTHYPDVVVKEPDLVFDLKCNMFIEMLQESSSHGRSQGLKKMRDSDSGICDDYGLSASTGYMQSSVQEEEVIEALPGYGAMPFTSSRSVFFCHRPLASALPLPVVAPGRRKSWATIASSPTSPKTIPALSLPPTPSIHCPDYLDFEDWSVRSNAKRSDSISSCVSSCSSSMTFSHDFSYDEDMGEDNESRWGTTFMRRVIQYGQKLQEEYRGDERRSVKTRLTEIFSLLAYPDPSHSPVAYLLGKSERDRLATKINTAILAHKQQRTISALEQFYRQTIVVGKTLALEGNGEASLLDMEKQCKTYSCDGI